MTTRREAREEALKLLFEYEINESDELHFRHSFIEQLVTGVREHKELLDRRLENYLINWTMDRLSLIDKSILRIALYEIIFLEDIPYAVSINEAIELAHKYGDDKSSKFINGVLSQIVKKGDTTR